MAITIGTLAPEVIGVIINALKANQATVESWIGSGETLVSTELTALIKDIPSVKGALAFVVGPVEAAVEAGIESYVADLIAKETPATIFELLIALLTEIQAKA
jgi:hypothetical protein